MIRALVLVTLTFLVTACGQEPKPRAYSNYAALLAKKTTPKYYDRHPSKITKEDIKLLDKLDDLAYMLAERRGHKIDVAAIYDFILRTKTHIDEVNLFKVMATMDIGSRTRNPYSNYHSYNPIHSKQFYSAYIEFTYPIWDKKTEQRVRNNELTYNLSILQKIQDYAQAYEDMQDAAEELEFLRMKQHVIKGEVLTGVKYRDERFQLLDKIREAKIKFRKARQETRILQIYLLNLTTDPNGLIKLL